MPEIPDSRPLARSRHPLLVVAALLGLLMVCAVAVGALNELSRPHRPGRMDLRPVLAAGQAALKTATRELDGPPDTYPDRVRDSIRDFHARIAEAKAHATDTYDLAALKALNDAAQGLAFVMLDVQFRNRPGSADRLLHDAKQAAASLESAEALMR